MNMLSFYRHLTKSFVILIAIIASTLATPSVYAEGASSELTIEDTGGVVRASGTTVDGKSAIEFHLQDASGKPAEGVEVSLVNKLDPSIVQRATATNGAVVFSDVAPGAWVVSTPNPTVTFMDITFLSDPALVGASAAAGGGGIVSGIGATAPLYVVGAGAIALPAVAIANENRKNNSNDDDTGSPGSATPTPVATIAPDLPTPVPTRRPTPLPTPIDETPVSPSS